MSEYTGLKRHKVSLAAVAIGPLRETFDYNREQTKPGRGRLRAVNLLEVPTQPAPIAVGSEGIVQEDLRGTEHSIGKQAARRLSHRLTTEDFIQVKLATFREGTKHCYWPADVLEKFLAADVIAPGNGQIRAYEDPNPILD